MNKEPLAYKICQKLHQEGYLAYYAGGYVRDLILKIPSDDIDIATDAPPEKLQSIFEKTIPIGIAFGIVVVVMEGVSFEVATFRKDLSYKDGRRPEEVSFCCPKEDALRRDFTINGMFYDPLKKEVLDYVNGEQDIQNKVIRAIGDPYKRFQEDRLRMIRAARFAARFNFKIESETKQAILSQAKDLFPSVSIERVYQEFQKMKKHHFENALKLLFDLKLLGEIFPSLKDYEESIFLDHLRHFQWIPKECPTFLYLLELFPKMSEDELSDLIDFLKVSNEKASLAYFSLNATKLLSHQPSKYHLVLFYADIRSDLVLKLIAARLSDQKREAFLKEHYKKQKLLKKHIEREKQKDPIVTSSFLMEHGIMPGKQLGQLLEKAKEIAIEKELEDPNEILKELHKSKLWTLS